MKKLVTALVVALICAGIGAAYLWQQWRDVRDVNASLEARVQTLENRPASAAPEAHGADIGVASAGSAAVSVEKEATSSQAAAATKPSLARLMISQAYPDLAQELGLTPGEFDKFLDLLASQQANQDYSAKRFEADQAAISAMLGSKYAQWQDYKQTLPARQQVNQLRGQLATTGSTLSEAQARPLMAALNAEQKRIEQDAREKPEPRAANQQEEMERNVQQVTDGNRRLITAATPYLTPQQLDSYRQMLDRQAGMVRAMIGTISAAQSQSGNTK